MCIVQSSLVERDSDHNNIIVERSNNKNSCLKIWDNNVERYINIPIRNCLIWFARTSALHPGKTIIGIILVSFFLIITGLYTNFTIETDGDILWTPSYSKPVQHGDWVDNISGFPKPTRKFVFIVHSNGANVLTMEITNCLFDVIETLQNTTGYKDTCTKSWNDDDCPIIAASGLFNHNRQEFLNAVNNDNDNLRIAMSRVEFPNGDPVVRDVIFGYPNPSKIIPTTNNNSSNIEDYYYLQSAQSYLGNLLLSPIAEIAQDYELAGTNALYELNTIWENNNKQCMVEVNTARSFDDEFERGITEDTPYMATAFIVMGVFCAIYLYKRKNLIQSQSIVGIGAVATIILSILSGYGLIFIIGVPFSSIAQIFPYVQVGIGLDDTFIITNSFSRKDIKANVVVRIVQVMEEVGVSIFVSTLTTVVAFSLGCSASLPGIRWFCYYAAPTVFIDFIYQITFFIAILAYDDHRIKAKRYDCLICVKAKHDDNQEENQQIENNITNSVSFTGKVMTRYADILLKPMVKCIVLLMFAVMLGLGVYGASQQRQELDFRDLTPTDSFIRTYFDALYTYSAAQSSPFLRAFVYFRDVDFSSVSIQRQMKKYIDDIVGLPFVSNRPDFFWIDDINEFVSSNETVSNMSFNDQVALFMETPPYADLYKTDIVRDEGGNVTASRAAIVFDQSSLFDVKAQIDSILEQRKVTKAQSINEGKDDWSFFTFDAIFYSWELYSVIVNEILFTVIFGLISVFFISLLFIPHPIGALLLTPVVAAIYCELMAVLYAAGIFINGASAVGLIMSIGLVVDYNFHIVLTYYETKVGSRDERVRKVLVTMGASILTGGVSTFLGVLPLAFTGSEMFRIFFVSFLAIPTLGVAHGLILVPVILSLIGPYDPLSTLEENTKKAEIAENHAEIEIAEKYANAGITENHANAGRSEDSATAKDRRRTLGERVSL